LLCFNQAQLQASQAEFQQYRSRLEQVQVRD